MAANIQDLLANLDAGVFEQKINHFLGDVAIAVVTHEKAGQVQLTFDLKQIENSSQVMIKYTLKYKQPTAGGTLTEDNAASCPMHVGRGGTITLFPEDQTDLFRAGE